LPNEAELVEAARDGSGQRQIEQTLLKCRGGQQAAENERQGSRDVAEPQEEQRKDSIEDHLYAYGPGRPDEALLRAWEKIEDDEDAFCHLPWAVPHAVVEYVACEVESDHDVEEGDDAKQAPNVEGAYLSGFPDMRVHRVTQGKGANDEEQCYSGPSVEHIVVRPVRHDQSRGGQ